MTVVEDPLDLRDDLHLLVDPARHADRARQPRAGRPFELHARSATSTIRYDRQTTITNADSDVTVKVYSSAGQVTKITDPNTNVTTYSYDAMNRETGETDAAGIGDRRDDDVHLRRRWQPGHIDRPRRRNHDHDLRRAGPRLDRQGRRTAA